MSVPAPAPLDPTSRWKALAVFAILAIVFVGWIVQQQLAATGPVVRTAPPVVFTDAEGKPVALDAYKGKPVLVNFWATWCGPCVEETPSFDRMAGLMKTKNPSLVILAASVDEGGWKDITPFLQKMGVKNLDVVLDDGDGARRFGTFKLPETWIVGRDGTLIDPSPTLRGVASSGRFVGPIDWDDPRVQSYLGTL